MSTLKVNTIRHTGASSDAVTLASDGTCTAKITNNLSNRNLIINGACNVAQRATSKAGAIGYQTVDRFDITQSGGQNAPDTAQRALTSSDTGPWAKGFRNCYQLTNGDQSSADADDYCEILYKIEAQDMAHSGWNYTSASSYISLSFWAKSSVAQNFYFFLKTSDGTAKQYPFQTGSLSANTWTKITKIIPGHADLTFDNNANEGLRLDFPLYYGTDKTNNSATVDQWANYSGSARTPDNTSTWWLQDDATFEITGLQLEVGDVATDFEHRSYGDELARCHRYYFLHTTGTDQFVGLANIYSDNKPYMQISFPVQMNHAPDLVQTTGSEHYRVLCDGGGDYFTEWAGTWMPTTTTASIYATSAEGVSGCVAGEAAMVYTKNAGAFIAFDSEL